MTRSGRFQSRCSQSLRIRKQRSHLGEERTVRLGCLFEDEEGERGEATIEFLGIVMIFVIPVFYLIVSLGLIQAAHYACETSARNGARILADDPSRLSVAQLATNLTFEDYDVRVPPRIAVSCEPWDCRVGGQVTVSVSADVPLPFLPEWLSSRMSMAVEASAVMPISGVELK